MVGEKNQRGDRAREWGRKRMNEGTNHDLQITSLGVEIKAIKDSLWGKVERTMSSQHESFKQCQFTPCPASNFYEGSVSN